MQRRTALIAALLLSITAACGQQEVSSSSEPSASAAGGPQKVVVLDYNVLDTLASLGLQDRVVGTAAATLPEHLKVSYPGVTDVGTMQEPDVEKIAELAPDAIVIGGRTEAKKPELEKIAPTTTVTLDPANWSTSFVSTQQALGDQFGQRSAVDDQLARLDEQFAATRKLAKGKGDALVLLVSGGKLSAVGPGSRFGMIHGVLGVEAADPQLKVDNHGQAVSFEYVKKVNPDRLYVIDRDAAIGQDGKSAREVLDNELIASTTAAKNGDVTYLDGARWYLLGNGLANTAEMTKAVQESLA